MKASLIFCLLLVACLATVFIHGLKHSTVTDESTTLENSTTVENSTAVENSTMPVSVEATEGPEVISTATLKEKLITIKSGLEPRQHLLTRTDAIDSVEAMEGPEVKSTATLKKEKPRTIKSGLEPQQHLLTLTDAIDDSEKKWIDIGTNSVYYIERTKKLTWFHAAWTCVLMGLEQTGQKGRLVNFESRAEQLLLQEHLNSLDSNMWIGLSKRDGDSFSWTDERIPTFTNWAKNQPDNWRNGEDCGEIVAKMQWNWNDQNCNARQPFICASYKSGNMDLSAEKELAVPCTGMNCKTPYVPFNTSASNISNCSDLAMTIALRNVHEDRRKTGATGGGLMPGIAVNIVISLLMLAVLAYALIKRQNHNKYY